MHWCCFRVLVAIIPRCANASEFVFVSVREFGQRTFFFYFEMHIVFRSCCCWNRTPPKHFVKELAGTIQIGGGTYRSTFVPIPLLAAVSLPAHLITSTVTYTGMWCPKDRKLVSCEDMKLYFKRTDSISMWYIGGWINKLTRTKIYIRYMLVFFESLFKAKVFVWLRFIFECSILKRCA